MKRCAAIGLALALPVFASCIFQNNPLEPNTPPTIRSYTPPETYICMIAPDSCTFSIGAVDPDGDSIMYLFVLGDSVLSRADTARFYAIKPGGYDIRGEARDGTTKASRQWHVDVLTKENAPPRITSSRPEQAVFSCAVGDAFEFHITAEDDQQQALQYRYLIDGALLSAGSPDLIHRFMERGDFLVEAVAWDGQYGDTVGWNIGVAGFPDTIAPAPILDLGRGARRDRRLDSACLDGAGR